MSVLPRAHGAAVLTARMRSTPEDFVVAEIDAFPPTGTGEHLLLTVEKRGMNTAFAASRIAQWAGVPEMAIGYAGLKDRHAVTRQRFSVHLPKRVAPDIAALESPDLRVLAGSWHAKKLPRGALGGNRFELVLREIDGERSAIDARSKNTVHRLDLDLDLALFRNETGIGPAVKAAELGHVVHDEERSASRFSSECRRA